MELILLLPFMIVLSDVTCTPSSSSFIDYVNSEGEFMGDFYSCGITEESGYSSLSHRHLTPMNVDGRKEEEGMNESNESVGRGGGIFISIHSSSFSSFPLHVLFEKLIFSMNEATIGRDIFIVYYSLEEQINETVFLSYDGNPLIPSKQCGSEESPCLSLSLVLSHLISSYENRVLIEEGVNIEEGMKFSDIIME
jgi:hypothetical protein